jgi:hypothetical protein
MTDTTYQMTKIKYTHPTWIRDGEPTGSTHDTFFVLLFNPQTNTPTIDLFVHRNGTFYGTPDDCEIIGWYPYNPPPVPLELSGYAFVANDNVVPINTN